MKSRWTRIFEPLRPAQFHEITEYRNQRSTRIIRAIPDCRDLPSDRVSTQTMSNSEIHSEGSPASKPCPAVVRPSTRADLDDIYEFIQPFVDAGRLLPRTVDELEDLIPTGFVALVDDEVVGFVALGVVLAAHGYPDNPRKGDAIRGLGSAAADAHVFHAGTATGANGEVLTSGGRVLCAVGLGDSVGAAQREAYALVDAIHWRDAQFRRDIGHRAISRERKGA